MHYKFAALLYCAAVLTPLSASAQQKTAGSNPADPAIAVPAAKYESAFTGYSRYRDEKLASWREVNDDAARVGGHMGIFGGAAGHAGHGTAQPQAQPPVSPPQSPAKAAPPMMHGGAHGEMKK